VDMGGVDVDFFAISRLLYFSKAWLVNIVVGDIRLGPQV